MADILIKIPDEIVSFVNINGFIPKKYLRDVSKALLESTPLPKGHGDLIDRNDLLVDSYCTVDLSGNEINIVEVMTVEMADAIIEADKDQE